MSKLTDDLMAELERMKDKALKSREKYREAEASGHYRNEDLAEMRQEIAEEGMMFGEYMQYTAVRLAVEFDEEQRASTITRGSLSQAELEHHFQTGKEHVETRDYHLAVVVFNRILSSDPTNARAFYYRGQVFARVDKYQLAADDFTRAIQSQPDFLDAYRSRARAYSRLHQAQSRWRSRDLELQDLTQIIQLKPDDADAYRERGLTFYLIEQYDAALSDFDESIRLSAGSDAHYYRARVYTELGDYERALADCELSLKYRPEWPSPASLIKEIKQKMASG